MSLLVGQAKLNEALKDLRIVWRATRERWDDEASLAFEKDHLEPLEPMIRSTTMALARLDELARAAQRECE
jgi:hypothetical protein